MRRGPSAGTDANSPALLQPGSFASGHLLPTRSGNERKGDLDMNERLNFDGNAFRRRLGRWYAFVRVWVAKSAIKVVAIYQLKSTYLPLFVASPGCSVVLAACVDDGGQAATYSRHQYRSPGYASSDPADSDRSGPYHSGTPIPVCDKRLFCGLVAMRTASPWLVQRQCRTRLAGGVSR